uniref:Dynactin subunit 2 n=2 Tax=Toxocara canis TaxID=6265 RepID=A0A183U0G5_TOXCA
LNELQRRREEPIRLVFHPEALEVGSLVGQLENVGRLLNEREERLAAQLAVVALTSTVAKEVAQLRDAIMNAQKAEDDSHADMNELQRAVDELKHARTHLDALKDAYNRIEQSPDTEALRVQMLDEQTTLGENYDAVERALEDRLDNLKRFNEDAADVEKRLSQLDESVREQGAASAEADLSLIDAIIERCNDVRPALDQLADSVQSLCPLVEPASRVDAFSSHQRELGDKLKILRDGVVRIKEECEAVNMLATALADLERVLTDAERGLEQTEGSVSALELFCEIPLRTVADKIALVDEMRSDVVTPKIEQLHQDKQALRERYIRLTERADEKLKGAKQQDELIADIETRLNSIRKEADVLCTKYVHPQDLSTAVEDANRLEALLEQLPEPSLIYHVADLERQEQLAKLLDTIQLSLKGLSVPLEEDVMKEQELLRDVRNTFAELTSLGDDVVAIDPESEPTEQLGNVAYLGDSLRRLKANIEKLETRLQSGEGLVKRTSLSEDLSARVAQLQDALENKKQQLTDRAKLHTLAPEIALITESVQGRLNEIEQSPLQSIDEQSATLQDLESKKQQLENLIESIPVGSEGDELRERSFWQLGQLNEMLKRLAAAVGDKLAALAAFNATKDEVQAQLSLIGTPSQVRLDTDSTQAISERINELNDKLSCVDKLISKLGSVPEAELDKGKLAEKRALLLAIEGIKHQIEEDRDSAQQQLHHAVAAEKMHADAEQLISKLAALIAEANKLLNDSEAHPAMYRTIADEFVLPLEHVEQLLKDASSEDVQLIPLNALVPEAKDVHSALLRRADIWRQFVAERDAGNDQLEAMRRPLDEIESKSLRSSEEVLRDMNALERANDELNKLKSTMAKLQNLSEQLHPLESAYADVRFFDVDVEQTQQQYEDLMSLMDNELHDENIFGESVEQLRRELDRLKDELEAALSNGQLEEILHHEVPALRAQLGLLESKHNDAKQSRVHVDRSSHPAVEALVRELDDIGQLTVKKLSDLAEAEKQEKIVVIRLELEKLRFEAPEEGQLIILEEQIQQLPEEDEETKVLAAQLQQIRADKQKREGVEKSLKEKLAKILQRVDEVDATVEPLIESTVRSKHKKKRSKKQPKLTLTTEEQINVLTDAVNEFDRDILPQLGDISEQSQQGEVQLSSLLAGRERAQEIADACKEALRYKVLEKENVKHVMSELAELDDKLLKSEEALANEQELKRSGDTALVTEKAKAAEELEHSLHAILEQLSTLELDGLSDEQRRDLEKKRERTGWMLDRIRVLCNALASMLDSLRAWESDKDVLRSATAALANEVRGLVDNYDNNAQPYTTACNDVKKANDLLERIGQTQQQLIDVNQRLRVTLPDCKAAIDDTNMMTVELDAVCNDVQE